MFKLLSIVVLTVFFTQYFMLSEALADRRDFKVFDVRKNLPLNDTDPIRYDYYVSIGQDQGVEKGALLTVYRRVPVMDVYRNLNHEDMQIPVAKLNIIYSERTMSVGRVVKLANRNKIPVLQFDKVMTGDRVELSGLSGKDQRRRVASVEPKSDRPKKASPPPVLVQTVEAKP